MKNIFIIALIFFLITFFKSSCSQESLDSNKVFADHFKKEYFDHQFKANLAFGIPAFSNFEFLNLNYLANYKKRFSLGAGVSLGILMIDLDFPQINSLDFFTFRYYLHSEFSIWNNEHFDFYLTGSAGTNYFVKDEISFPNYSFEKTRQFNFFDFGGGIFIGRNGYKDQLMGFYIEYSTTVYRQIKGSYFNESNQLEMDFDLTHFSYLIRLGFKINIEGMRHLN
jgi:hypothetical protein